MKYIKDRGRELSTAAGASMVIASLASFLGFNFGAEEVGTIGMAIGGCVGVFEIFRKEQK